MDKYRGRSGENMKKGKKWNETGGIRKKRKENKTKCWWMGIQGNAWMKRTGCAAGGSASFRL
jgi:hypothetical protein